MSYPGGIIAFGYVVADHGRLVPDERPFHGDLTAAAVVVRIYEWIALEGRLLDGTAFSESITELVRKRSFTNPRGKHKTKTRSRYLLNLRFDYPADLYGNPCLIRQQPEEIRVPASASGCTASSSR